MKSSIKIAAIIGGVALLIGTIAALSSGGWLLYERLESKPSDADPKTCNPECINGTCVDGKCVCSTNGWTGSDCGTMTCSKPCNNGKCVGAKCECDEGWKGAYCDIKKCEPKCKRGECVDGRCACPDGWGGDDCDTKLCEPQCKSGSCVDGKCVCNPFTKGVACEIDICDPECVNGGTCGAPGEICNCAEGMVRRNMLDDSCACKPGWSGEKCDTPVCNPPCSKEFGYDCVAPNSCVSKLVGIEAPKLTPHSADTMPRTYAAFVGTGGNVTRTPVLTNQASVTGEQCAQACVDDPNCTAAEYLPNGGGSMAFTRGGNVRVINTSNAKCNLISGCDPSQPKSCPLQLEGKGVKGFTYLKNAATLRYGDVIVLFNVIKVTAGGVPRRTVLMVDDEKTISHYSTDFIDSNSALSINNARWILRHPRDSMLESTTTNWYNFAGPGGTGGFMLESYKYPNHYINFAELKQNSASKLQVPRMWTPQGPVPPSCSGDVCDSKAYSARFVRSEYANVKDPRMAPQAFGIKSGEQIVIMPEAWSWNLTESDPKPLRMLSSSSDDKQALVFTYACPTGAQSKCNTSPDLKNALKGFITGVFSSTDTCANANNLDCTRNERIEYTVVRVSTVQNYSKFTDDTMIIPIRSVQFKCDPLMFGTNISNGSCNKINYHEKKYLETVIKNGSSYTTKSISCPVGETCVATFPSSEFTEEKWGVADVEIEYNYTGADGAPKTKYARRSSDLFGQSTDYDRLFDFSANTNEPFKPYCLSDGRLIMDSRDKRKPSEVPIKCDINKQCATSFGGTDRYQYICEATQPTCSGYVYNHRWGKCGGSVKRELYKKNTYV